MSVPIGDWLSLPKPVRRDSMYSVTARLNEIYDSVGYNTTLSNLISVMNDALFEKPQQYEIDWKDELDRSHKLQNSESKYLPKKTATSSKKTKAQQAIRRKRK